MHRQHLKQRLSTIRQLGARAIAAAFVLLSLAVVAPSAAHAAGAAEYSGLRRAAPFAPAAPGAVYVMSNDAAGNAILVFDRAPDGSLTPAGSYATGGLGTGGGLGSQGAVVLSLDQRWLFAVNAASDDISVFAAVPTGLQLVDRVASGGDRPISLTAHGSLLYMLNAGDPGSITGFTQAPDGRLAPLAGSTRPLSNGGAGAAPAPAQISFSPDGRSLIVTEKASNQIVGYAVDQAGMASAPAVYPSSGSTPFGFAFCLRGTLVVSEAFGGAPNASAASSYSVQGDSVQLVSGSVPTLQTAACWVAVTGDGRYAYTTNAGSGSIAGYAVAPDGSLTLLDSQAGLTGAGSAPIDVTITPNNQFLYVVTAASDQLAAFAVQADGSLTALGMLSLPASALGVAAR